MLGLIALLLSSAAMVVAVTKTAAAAPEYIPTVGQIAAADSLAKLNTYYDLIGELYIRGKIPQTKYSELYAAYEARYYELVGVL